MNILKLQDALEEAGAYPGTLRIDFLLNGTLDISIDAPDQPHRPMITITRKFVEDAAVDVERLVAAKFAKFVFRASK